MVAEAASRRLAPRARLRPSAQDQAKLISELQEEPRKAHDSAYLLDARYASTFQTQLQHRCSSPCELAWCSRLVLKWWTYPWESSILDFCAPEHKQAEGRPKHTMQMAGLPCSHLQTCSYTAIWEKPQEGSLQAAQVRCQATS